MRRPHISRHAGYTLVELIIAMVAFMLVIIIAARAFDSAIRASRVVSKSEESNIEGVVGLETLRHDLEQAGFGLFTDVDTPPPAYSEASEPQPALYNDAPSTAAPSGIPRPIVAADFGNYSSDYLVLKGTTLSLSKIAKKWTYENFSSASKVWPGSDNLADGVDTVIVVGQKFKDGLLKRKLVYDTAATSTLAVTYKANGKYGTPFIPTLPGQQYYYYGIDTTASSAPFNRTDYLVNKNRNDPNLSKSCAPGAGTLYKTVMSQADGKMAPIPLLDCVADMQVVLGWNTAYNPGQSVDTYTSGMKADGTPTTVSGAGTANTISMTDPAFVRTRLKLIKVYILAQDGAFDKNFINSSTPQVVGDSGESNLTRSIDLTGPNYQNYRWKLYRIVVKTKNMN